MAWALLLRKSLATPETRPERPRKTKGQSGRRYKGGKRYSDEEKSKASCLHRVASLLVDLSGSSGNRMSI